MDEQRRPHILVTGAAGALAQQVIDRLRETCDLVAVDFRDQVYLGDDIPSYCIDFNKRSFEDLFRRYKFDGVIHLGRIMSSQLTRMRRYNANVLGTQKLLDLSHKYGIKRIVVLSTFHVYGAVAYNPALIDEEAPLKSAGLSADLIDSVELENLANIYLWRYPDLNISILRPCNIVGPGVRNSISTLLGMERAPVLAGFSPIMQFIHIDDMADAIVLAYNKPKRGVFNVAPEDWVAYQHALKLCGCKPIPIPSIPPVLPKMILGTLKLRSFPSYLMAFFKYPVVIDGRAFAREFEFTPRRPLKEIFRFYRENKKPV
ncbi:NAD-dependent epimerase [Marinobacter vulgaris]|uniref:NAD-dependent epimerase n=1 Tax=Marinobacter vulgaris TaxID=1928331 RepID=A0A2V3ZMH8_9GAMM|nr:SDR family oxidoreductase [Marinobacter vulgaris]PXX91997.1 NAD-dependent epimerase [Marinobacter vulgaris]TSJ70493.1 SDR family oxidoreductase [Marinobacter vulgaris]